LPEIKLSVNQFEPKFLNVQEQENLIKGGFFLNPDFIRTANVNMVCFLDYVYTPVGASQIQGINYDCLNSLDFVDRNMSFFSSTDLNVQEIFANSSLVFNGDAYTQVQEVFDNLLAFNINTDVLGLNDNLFAFYMNSAFYTDDSDSIFIQFVKNSFANSQRGLLNQLSKNLQDLKLKKNVLCGSKGQAFTSTFYSKAFVKRYVSSVMQKNRASVDLSRKLDLVRVYMRPLQFIWRYPQIFAFILDESVDFEPFAFPGFANLVNFGLHYSWFRNKKGNQRFCRFVCMRERL